MESHSTLFFKDGRKTVDFVLVYNSTLLNNESLSKLEFFLDNLSRTGLYAEVDPFTVDSTTHFMKIHIPRKLVVSYADIFDIELACNRTRGPSNIDIPYQFMATPLTRPDPAAPIYARAPDTFSQKQPKDTTSAERIMVLYKVLSRTKFGHERSSYGIHKLLKEKVFIDAFPLHEGPHEWPESGPLTDRQLLAKFWGSPKCWYKEQPLNLIEKYYGTELAFYFAWLGLYIKLLIPAAIMSLLCLFYGIASITTTDNSRSFEICNSDILMCPRCHYVHCKYTKLSNSCLQSHVSYLFDNPASITFAIIISFWSTVFMELWGRNQAVLQLEWNVKSLEYDISMRPEYAQAAVKTKVSRISGVSVPYIPKKTRIVRYTVTSATVALMLVIMVLGTFGVMIYRLSMILILHKNSKEKISNQNTLIAVITGSFISVCFIQIFKMIYTKVALWLTNLENHRTQHQYDNSYIYKSYALAFTNHYAVVFYIAFFKGRFFTYPGDISLWTNMGAIGSDICDPTGCILDLSIQLMFIMIMKIFVNNFMQLFFPWFKEFLQKRTRKLINMEGKPQHEKDYLKAPLERFYLIDEYMDMVIQYGFVVFFVAAFPLAPLLALLNNLVELRVDAYKFTRSFRRPIPEKVAGMGAWMGILQALTYVGVVTNALVIAFTSEFVPKEIYRHEVDYRLRGFINTTISAFDRSELDPSPNATICYYPGKRYPPDHPDKYQLTTDYWYILAMRFTVVVMFEQFIDQAGIEYEAKEDCYNFRFHIVMITNGILAYAIPDVPAHVTERLAMEEKKNKEMRMAALDEEYDHKKRRTSIVGLIHVD